ncbi:hypothetical protein PR202_gb03014 [Eleusine coracana subsp. coracana]|uniref:Uncharacterized protein n=1 Tax=Eleusine coracana subsp. coracana TaxID=191504 RepID=A0AAV5DYD9_ELECO|nr:hypothetical protein PR202_gb03014 [Eleusine coracana subsp. coracana]
MAKGGLSKLRCNDIQAVVTRRRRAASSTRRTTPRRFAAAGNRAEELVGHPLFQTLVDRTAGGGTVVGCEVVLFEHMLWMLENADPQPESLEDLVEYYAC